MTETDADFLGTTGPLTRRAALQILLEECYRDPKLDPSKDGTLTGLARAIGVEARMARRIARSARRRAAAGQLGAPATFEPQRVYERAEGIAFVDGKLQPREIAILERLRKVIRLPPLHPELEADSDDTPRTPLPAPLGRPRPVKPAPVAAIVPPLAPLERAPALAEAGQLEELARVLGTVLANAPPGRDLERAYRKAVADSLRRLESRPDLDHAAQLVAVTRELADRVRSVGHLWATFARAAARLARELVRRGAWDLHEKLARQIYEVDGDHASEVAPHRARLLRDAMLRRFESRQQDEGWALFTALRTLHAAAPDREGVARELGIAMGRAFQCTDIGTKLGDVELLRAAQDLLALARAYPRDLALVRRAVAAGPLIAPVMLRHGPPDALERYLADLSTTSMHWPGHEAVYAGIAKACEKVVVLSELERPTDPHTPAAGLVLLKELRRASPSSAGVADAMVMVAAQTGISLDFGPGGKAAAPLDLLHEEVRELWQLGEELAALPDDALLRERITRLLPDDEPRLGRAAIGEPSRTPEDAAYVIDVMHEVERQMDRCTGTYWTARADWFRARVTSIGEHGDPRLARLAASICERLCWPEPF